MSLVYITQGQHAVGREPEMIITTILGSCISICLWDPEARVGGMNHLLLPDARSGGNSLSEGAVDMDLLINRMMPLGALRPRLRAKIFGGSSMLGGRTDIGQRNAEFGRDYLRSEGIPCDAESLGGDKARRLRFWPANGQAQMKLVKEEAPAPKPVPAPVGNDVDLF
jgi:chemotaxis protein CheD